MLSWVAPVAESRRGTFSSGEQEAIKASHSQIAESNSSKFGKSVHSCRHSDHSQAPPPTTGDTPPKTGVRS